MFIKTADDTNIDLDLSFDKFKQHIDKSNSYAKVIIEQINNSNLYSFLKGKKDLTIVDIGANVGFFTLFCSTIAKQIISVEPTPEFVEMLKNNTKNISNIEIVEKAISAISGNTKFYLNDNNSTMNSIEYKTNNSIDVECITLEDLLVDLENVDFIKVDIEGGEVFALSKEQIEKVSNKVNSWFVEAHETNTASIQQNRMILEARFKDVGYNTERHGVDGLYVYR